MAVFAPPVVLVLIIARAPGSLVMRWYMAQI